VKTILFVVFLLTVSVSAQDVLRHGTRPLDFDQTQEPTELAAELLEALDIAYPDTAVRRGWEGVSIIAAWIDRHGDVAYAELAQSSGYGMLDSAALQAVLRGYFKAAQRGGRPVGSRLSIPVEFRLRRDENAYDAVKSGEQLEQEADEIRRAKEMLEEEQRRVEEEIRRLREQIRKDSSRTQAP